MYRIYETHFQKKSKAKNVPHPSSTRAVPAEGHADRRRNKKNVATSSTRAASAGGHADPLTRLVNAFKDVFAGGK